MNSPEASEPTSNADKIQAAKTIAEIHRKLHQQRIERSFRVVIHALSFFALCVAARYADKVDLPDHAWWVVGIAFLGLAVLVAMDFVASGKANGVNQEIAEAADKTLMTIAGPPLNEYSRGKHPRKSAVVWECGAVFLAATVATSLITNPCPLWGFVAVIVVAICVGQWLGDSPT